MSLPSADLKDCILSVFHISDSYALLSGEVLPAAHTSTNAALRAHLLGRLVGNDSGLDLYVKIGRRSESIRSRS